VPLIQQLNAQADVCGDPLNNGQKIAGPWRTIEEVLEAMSRLTQKNVARRHG
jgi:hypothetical protein